MTKDELNSALDLNKQIERLQERLDDLRATGGVGSTGTNEPVTGGISVEVNQIVVELADEIGELHKGLEVRKVVIQHELGKLSLEPVELKLMVCRYVKCMRWKLVEMAICYSRAKMFGLHKDILLKVWT